MHGPSLPPRLGEPLAASRLERAVTGALALAAWGVVAWLAWPPRQAAAPDVPRPAVAVDAAPAQAVATVQPAARAGHRHIRRVAFAAPRRTAPPDRCPGGAGGAVRSSTPDLPAREDSLRRWLATMESTADDRVRAAGWFIDLGREGTAARDQLATLAATSSDPVLQAFAQRACRSAAGESSACQALPPDAWTKLEPDNAAALLAQAADPRLDDAAQLRALEAAARATRFDTHLLELHALAESARPADAGDADRVAMATEVVRARADWLATEALRAHCSGTALTDDAVRAACALIADQLPTQARTLADLQEARELGERLDWPSGRLDGLRDTAAALEAVERARTQLDDEGDCAQLAVAGNFYADVGQRGEIGALSKGQDDVKSQ